MSSDCMPYAIQWKHNGLLDKYEVSTNVQPYCTFFGGPVNCCVLVLLGNAAKSDTFILILFDGDINSHRDVSPMNEYDCTHGNLQHWIQQEINGNNSFFLASYCNFIVMLLANFFFVAII